MQFTADSTALVSVLKRLCSVAADRPVLPMFGSIKVKATSESGVTLFSYHPTMAAQASIESTNSGPFEFGLNADVFLGVVSVLPKNTEVSTTIDQTSISLSAGKSAFKLNTLREDIFRKPKQYADMPFVEIDTRAFIDKMKKVSFCRNNKSEREIFSSVCLNSDHFVSTDGYRMSYVPNGILRVPDSILIAGETADRLQKLFDKVTGKGLFYGTQTEISLAIGDTYVTSSLLVNKFPAYKSTLTAIQAATHVRCLAKRADVIDAIGRTIAVSSSSEMKQVEMVFDLNVLKFYSHDKTAGDASDVIACEGPGAPGAILLNGAYLQEAVKNYTSDQIVFEYRGEDLPLIITDGEHVNVIQPIKR